MKSILIMIASDYKFWKGDSEQIDDLNILIMSHLTVNIHFYF